MSNYNGIKMVFEFLDVDKYVKDASVNWDDYASAASDKGFPVHSLDVFNALTRNMEIPIE